MLDNEFKFTPRSKQPGGDIPNLNAEYEQQLNTILQTIEGISNQDWLEKIIERAQQQKVKVATEAERLENQMTFTKREEPADDGLDMTFKKKN
jgi:hypothetical protein